VADRPTFRIILEHLKYSFTIKAIRTFKALNNVTAVRRSTMAKSVWEAARVQRWTIQKGVSVMGMLNWNVFSGFNNLKTDQFLKKKTKSGKRFERKKKREQTMWLRIWTWLCEAPMLPSSRKLA
jgi:hypothetical protein